MLILVNVLKSVDSSIYLNHIEFFCRVKELYPKKDGHEIWILAPPRMSIDMARNWAAKQALLRECDYLMFIDDDVLVPSNTLEQLIKADADIAAGLVIIRAYPFNVMAFEKKDGSVSSFNDLPMVEVEVEPEIKEDSLGRGKPALIKKILKNPVTRDDNLHSVGFSCALIKVSILRKIPLPFFVTGPHNTEDIYFCDKATEYIKDLKISLVTSCQPAHYLHPEPIEWRCIDVFREFYAILQPEITKNIVNGGRDLEYIKAHLKELK